MLHEISVIKTIQSSFQGFLWTEDKQKKKEKIMLNEI